MVIYKIKSYAKINLALNVVGKISKLHKIESIVSFLDYHDLIFINQIFKKKHEILFYGKFSKKIKKKNSISELLRILDKKNLLDNRKFNIKIKKNIPQKSGLGGGSMNAASLLNFFIRKKLIKFKNKKEIFNISKLIGSDVGLGIEPKNTFVSWKGKVTKFTKKKILYTLVVKPNFGCSTKYIYSRVKSFTKPEFIFLKKDMFDYNFLKNCNNDLEKIAFLRYPILKKIKFFLETLPKVTFVRMTGSGSAIVAYFNSKKLSEYAKNKFKKKYKSYWCISSKTI